MKTRSCLVTAAATSICLLIGCSRQSNPPVSDQPVHVQPSPSQDRATHDNASRDRASGDTIQVYPGDDIQDALDQAAKRSLRRVVVHPGHYAPKSHGQALIHFNRQHDGIHLQANGDVVLTAANPDVADPNHQSYPAIVNHVVYFGDGISSQTKISGFSITGANNFVTTNRGPEIEPNSDEPRLSKTAFFYTDGGAVKVFGRSYPVIEELTIFDNYASPNSGGISIEHRGFTGEAVRIRNCVFRNNRAPLTGSAIALLDHEYGSAAIIENCLFDRNLSSCELDRRSESLGTWNRQSGHGALTVFAFSKAEVRRCTFVGNRNGADDLSQTSTYSDCIFWENTAPGGWPLGERGERGERYDLRAANANSMTGCFVSSNSLQFDPRKNMLQAPDPNFDARWVPQSPVYGEVGYRPTQQVEQKQANVADNPIIDIANGPKNHNIPTPLNISLVGREFNWQIRYPGDDNQLGTDDDVLTRRHLRIPAGTKIRLTVESQDYLYQLSLPKQELKAVAVPGMTRRQWLEVAAPGIHPLVGDQFCGYTHPNLIGKLIVQEPEDFLSWLKTQSKD